MDRDVRNPLPLQGFRNRNGLGGPAARGSNALRFREWMVGLTFWVGLSITITVLGLNLYFLASKSKDSPQNWSVVYTIFAAIISIAAWILVKLVTDRIGDSKKRAMRGFLVLFSASLIYGGAVGWTVLTIQPAQPCTDSNFVNDNNLMGGSEQRCHLVYISFGILCFGNIRYLTSLDNVVGVAFSVISAVLKVRAEHEAEDNFAMG